MLFSKKILILLSIILTSIFSNAQNFDYFENINYEEKLTLQEFDYYQNVYIEEVAKTHLGTKYVWGGNGGVGYDCSGFTKEVFEQNGIEIPRNSWKQAEVGRKVKKRDLKKGDLIFFNSKNQKRVNHVGIYLGDGKFIHASSFHKRIVISKFKEYKRYFKWGRRVT
jgi:cell wall-associated NlpC family hydrolase